MGYEKSFQEISEEGKRRLLGKIVFQLKLIIITRFYGIQK